MSPFAGWSRAPVDASEHPGVHVWGASVGELLDAVGAFSASLSESERDRASAFRFEHHRAAYVVAHGVLRDIVSRYLKTDITAIEFNVTDDGRPFLAGEGEKSIDFNLSHAGDAVVVAIALNQKLGVDVEEIRDDLDYESLAARFFASSEIEQLRTADPEVAPTDFFKCWTRKEAIVKAVGSGLSMPLDSFSVSVSATRQSVTTGDDETWTVVDLGLSSGYTGALAMEREAELKAWVRGPAAPAGRR